MAKIKKYGQSAVSGKDIRLRKKIKPVNQGGGPNFLGKAETVTVPKQWLSSPDHVVAELAYITPAEQKMLIEADLYGSLNGKPNRGPAGLLSLQGDMGSVGGGNDGHAGDTDTSDAETDDPATAGAGSTEAGYSSGPDNQAGTADDVMGTPGSDLGGYQGSTGPSFGGYAGSPFGPNPTEVSYVTPELTGYNMAGLNRSQYAQLPGYMKAMMSIAPPIGYNINPITGKIEGYRSAPIGILGNVLSGVHSMLMGPPQTSKDLFDRAVTTGYGPEGNVGGENYDGGDGYDDRPQIAPVNPATGQCDAGYMFDEDMQACRLDTGFDASGENGGVAPESGAYARMGLLDVAPTGLPEFQQQYGAGFGTPLEFTDANLAFRRRGAYRPQYFDQPYPTTGYTLLS